jgi:hypothetical protein
VDALSRTAPTCPTVSCELCFGWRFEILDNDPQAVAHAKLAKGFAESFGERADEQIALIGQLIGLDYSTSPHISGIAGDGKQLRERAFHAVTQYFRRLLQEGNALAVVLLDDLHWADEGSLDFIDHMVHACRDLPVMLLCLTRSMLDERRPRWGRDGDSAQRIDLGPLSKRGSQELVESLLRRIEPRPAALCDVVTNNAEGNPYFIEELVAMLIDDGVITTEGDRWRVATEKLVDARVPATLAGVLQARLDGLPATEKLALQHASVIGHVFWDEPLQRAVPDMRALDSLLRRDLVRAREPSSFDGCARVCVQAPSAAPGDLRQCAQGRQAPAAPSGRRMAGSQEWRALRRILRAHRGSLRARGRYCDRGDVLAPSGGRGRKSLCR